MINAWPLRSVTEKKCRTDPYCPPVWVIPSDDSPFIIESDEEFPAGAGKKMGDKVSRDTVKGDRCEGLRELT